MSRAREGHVDRARMADLLGPYYPEPRPLMLDQLLVYLELLMKWNARTNLTAIRSPEEVVCRHFGESLFAARHLPTAGSLLDFGSGAGFPGLPIQLANPGLCVTLAESQHKKSAFLREIVRSLGLTTEVWAGRAEDLPAERGFDVLTLRAVDRPTDALATALGRLRPGGLLVELTVEFSGEARSGSASISIPNSDRGILRLTRVVSGGE